MMLELENDEANTLNFDLEAQDPKNPGFSKLAFAYQHGNRSNLALLRYYGTINDKRNKLEFFMPVDKSPVIFCIKQLGTKYLAVSKVSVIEIFDITTLSSVRVVTDLGLSLTGMFRVNHPKMRTNVFYR